MAHVLYCKDMGIDCSAEIRGTDTDEVVQKAVEHGREHHGLKEVSPAMQEKIRAAVKEEPATF